MWGIYNTNIRVFSIYAILYYSTRSLTWHLKCCVFYSTTRDSRVFKWLLCHNITSCPSSGGSGGGGRSGGMSSVAGSRWSPGVTDRSGSVLTVPTGQQPRIWPPVSCWGPGRRLRTEVIWNIPKHWRRFEGGTELWNRNFFIWVFDLTAWKTALLVIKSLVLLIVLLIQELVKFSLAKCCIWSCCTARQTFIVVQLDIVFMLKSFLVLLCEENPTVVIKKKPGLYWLC